MIRANTGVTGVIVDIRKLAQSPHLAVAIRFNPIPCSERESSLMTPLLIALQHADKSLDYSMQRMQTAAVEQQALTQMFAPPNYNDPKTLPLPAISGNNTAQSATHVLNSIGMGASGSSEQLRTGEVSGLQGIKMELPSGNTVTTLTASRDLAMERNTTFVFTFVPQPETEHHTAWTVAEDFSSEKIETRSIKPPVPPPVEAEVCAAGGCKDFAPTLSGAPAGKEGHSASDLSVHGPGQGSTPASWTISLAQLGFHPRMHRSVVDFDDDATVQFLGEDQVLLTFNTHSLVERTAEQREHGWKPRRVRAVLLSRESGQVLRVENWIVPQDSGAVVWSLNDGAILAHVGDALIRYGSGLTEEGRYALKHPLLFVTVSPEAHSILVAMIHEKHTAAEHARLQALLSSGWPVSEDYDLAALDGGLREIATHLLTVEPVQPALLAAATVSVQPARGGSWTVEETTWTGVKKALAHFGSTCDVQLASLPGNRLFAQGCLPSHSDQPWYRLLDMSGATLLRGQGSRTELIQQAVANSDGSEIAVATSQFAAPVNLHGSVYEDQFTHLTVVVYNAATGRPLAVAVPPGGSAMRQTVALSASGSGLAVLGGGQLLVYNLAALASPVLPAY